MPPTFQLHPPTFFTNNATSFIPQGQHGDPDPPSKGFWVGVSFFVVITLALALRYSYLASTYRFRRLRRRLGLYRPSGGTGNAGGEIWDWHFNTPIRRPEPAYLGGIGSYETLPSYRFSTNFSSEVLEALKRFGAEQQPGQRPPSYRSRLTWDLEAAVGAGSTGQDQERRVEDSRVERNGDGGKRDPTRRSAGKRDLNEGTTRTLRQGQQRRLDAAQGESNADNGMIETKNGRSGGGRRIREI